MSIVIASNNPKKTQEIEQIFAKEKIAVVSQANFGVPAVNETGLTFVENAILKARSAARYTRMSALGDDSGLEVEALSGRPGIYSSRFAGSNATDHDNIIKLLQELRDIPESRRQAQFQCVVVFLKHAEDPTPIVCQGTWSGRIVFEPEGSGGFGYDPVFWVKEYNCTAAKLSPTIKNKISHRAKAIEKMAKILKKMVV